MEVSYVSKKATMAKQQSSVTDPTRPPLVPSERNNGRRRTKSIDISSRYRSPTPTKTQRYPSPTVTRTVSSTSPLLSRRAESVERKRSSTPTYPSTPVSDVTIDSSRTLSTSRLPESLWPSTMRSLSVSFQSDSVSVPVVKKEKLFVTSPNDWSLRPIAQQQQGETITSLLRKHTPERKRSPLKGNNVSNQLENSKPVDGTYSKISRINTSHSRNRSLDLGDKPVSRRMSLPLSKIPKPLQKSSSDAARLLSSYGLVMSPRNSEDGNNNSLTLDRTSLPRFQPLSAPGSRAPSPSRSSLSSSSSSSNSRGMSPSRGLSPSRGVTSLRGLSPSRGSNIPCLRSPTPQQRGVSPSRGTNIPCLRSPTPQQRGVSPSRGTNIPCLRSPTPPQRGLSPSRGTNIPCLRSPSTPQRGVSPSRGTNIPCLRSPTPPQRGVSPSRIRQTNTSTQSSSAITSVLSFFADVKKGKKATYIEDVHQVRLLYNRYLQWRFANARAERVSYTQRLIAEETLYNVWHATSDLRDLVTAQRICLQQMKLEIKLQSILNAQMVCLEDWAVLEREHISSLAGAIGDLEANTVRLPLAGGTKADLGSLKLAMSSALDVMEAMGSSIRSLNSQMEEMNKLVSDLSVVTKKEKFMLDKCDHLLASTSVMEIEERSLMTHLIQNKHEEEVR